MKKLFGLALLALAFLASDPAQAANRYAICSTACTWDNTSTAMWSTTSGGATGASAPTSSDVAILDNNTCVGGTTCTITTFAGTISLSELQFSTCTGSTTGCILDASANNTNFTISSGGNTVSFGGTGTRTLNMGNGTWNLTAGQAYWAGTNCTNLTLNANSSTITFSASITNQSRFDGCGKTYNVVSFAGGGTAAIFIGGSNTFNTLTFNNTAIVTFGNSTTQTITTLTNYSGSASAALIMASSNAIFAGFTISSANNWTCNYCAFNRATFTGGGTFTANNSFNTGGNSGITINGPTSGGGGRIIGG